MANCIWPESREPNDKRNHTPKTSLSSQKWTDYFWNGLILKNGLVNYELVGCEISNIILIRWYFYLIVFTTGECLKRKERLYPCGNLRRENPLHYSYQFLMFWEHSVVMFSLLHNCDISLSCDRVEYSVELFLPLLVLTIRIILTQTFHLFTGFFNLLTDSVTILFSFHVSYVNASTWQPRSKLEQQLSVFLLKKGFISLLWILSVLYGHWSNNLLRPLLLRPFLLYGYIYNIHQ